MTRETGGIYLGSHDGSMVLGPYGEDEPMEQHRAKLALGWPAQPVYRAVAADYATAVAGVKSAVAEEREKERTPPPKR